MSDAGVLLSGVVVSYALWLLLVAWWWWGE